MGRKEELVYRLCFDGYYENIFVEGRRLTITTNSEVYSYSTFAVNGHFEVEVKVRSPQLNNSRRLNIGPITEQEARQAIIDRVIGIHNLFHDSPELKEVLESNYLS